MNEITFARYLQIVFKELRAPEAMHCRIGQCCFNILHATHPEIANKIRGSKDDPYPEREWNSPVIERFLNRIQRELDSQSKN